jgi:hypothetical protein
MISPEWLAAATALAAAVIGPLVTIYATNKQNQTTLRVARDQISASTVSASRQKWIDSLRDTIAEFLAVAGQQSYLALKDEGAAWADDASAQRVVLLRARIALLINPRETDHRELFQMVTELMSLVRAMRDPAARRRSSELHHDITEKAQAILKREWERVKSGETLPGRI